MNKTERVLHHLQKYGHITSIDAFEKYHATRLSAIIYNLRKHYLIETEYKFTVDEYGHRTRYGVYSLMEQEDKP